MKQNSCVNWFIEMNEDDFVDRLYWQSFLYEKDELQSQEVREVDIFDPGKVIEINGSLGKSSLIYKVEIPFIKKSLVVVPSKSILFNITSDVEDFDVISHIKDFVYNAFNVDCSNSIDYEVISYRESTIKKYLVIIHFDIDNQFYDNSSIGLNQLAKLEKQKFILELSRSIADHMNRSDEVNHGPFKDSYYENLYRDFRSKQLLNYKNHVKKIVYPIFKYRDQRDLYEIYNIGEKVKMNSELEMIENFYNKFLDIYESYSTSLINSDPYSIQPISKTIQAFVKEAEELRESYV